MVVRVGEADLGGEDVELRRASRAELPVGYAEGLLEGCDLLARHRSGAAQEKDAVEGLDRLVAELVAGLLQSVLGRIWPDRAMSTSLSVRPKSVRSCRAVMFIP